MPNRSDINPRPDRKSEEPDPQCDRMLEELDELLVEFESQALPGDVADPGFFARFAHIDLPSHHIEGLMEQMYESFSRLQEEARVFFIVSDIQGAMAPTIAAKQDGLAPVILTYSQFLGLLRANRGDVDSSGRGRVWKAGRQPEAWNLWQYIPWKAIFIMQIDSSLPADCALSLVGLVQWTIDHAMIQESAIRVLTMSADSDCGILPRLVDLVKPTSRVARLDLSADPTARNLALCRVAKEQVVSDALKSFEKHLDQPQVALFFDVDIEDELEELTKASKVPVKEFEIESPEAIRALRAFQTCDQSEPHSLVIVVNSNTLVLPFAFEGYANVHVALNPVHGGRLAWDDDARQLVWSCRGDFSREERMRQLGWAVQPNAGRVFIYSGTDIDSFSDVEFSIDRQIEGVQLGGFIAALFDLQSWGISVLDTLPVFIRYLPRISDMLDRLKVQGIISQQGFALGGREGAVFRAVLPVCGYDHRLALLVALDSNDRAVRRVRVQVAALLSDDVNNLLSLEPAALSNEPGVRNRVLEMCSGTASALADQGSIWLVLGLWKFYLALQYNGARNSREQEASQLFDLVERNATERWQKVLELVAAMERTGAFTREDVNELKRGITAEDHVLDESQVHDVQKSLLRAFLHQLVFGHHPERGNATMVHEVVSTVVDLGPIDQKMMVTNFIDKNKLLAQEGSRGVLGICSMFMRAESRIFATDWTWIPAWVVNDWKQEHAPEKHSLYNALSCGMGS